MSFAKTAAVIGVFALAPAANAASLDFTIPSGGFTVQSYTDAAGSTAPNFVGGGITSEAGFESIVIDAIGENLDITISDPGAGNPYFDADSGGLPGGLGSCRNLTGSAQCTPNSDDNLTIGSGESLRLDFALDDGSTIGATFGDFTFRDDDHLLINGTISVIHDSGVAMISILNGIGDLSGIGVSEFLVFDDAGTQNYYVSGATITAVPVPAAVWLFGSALMGLGWMRKKHIA